MEEESTLLGALLKLDVQKIGLECHQRCERDASYRSLLGSDLLFRDAEGVVRGI